MTRIMTPKAFKVRNIYKKLRPLHYLAYFTLIFLSFFEKPDWCI